ncbi:putative uncharacterized protein orfY40 [Clostridium sp. CAG:762]|nr:putative uncharacterized protein orfY40 [Clostridium sp. CAG:762]
MNDSLKNMKPKKQKINSKYTEDWLPIKAIANGTIVLDNNMKVTGVKITPRNIFILDQITQENVIVALKNFYNTLDFEFWIISADRPVDISAYLAQLQLLYNSVNSTVIRKMIMQDLQKANMFMDNNVTDTEYFLLFKERNPEVIQKRLRTIMMGLANAGLTATQTSNSDLRSIMENFLNGGMNTEFGTVISS